MSRPIIQPCLAVAGLALGLALLSPAPAAAQDRGGAPSATSGTDYTDPANWLCRPGRADACAVDLTTSAIASDGSVTVEDFRPDPNPSVDCFYVYPTVSTDPTANSDLEADAAERSVIRSQFARFRAVCRTFAPLYRQVTLTALRAGAAGDPMDVDRDMPYRDVRAAWRDYLARDNDGRGVILVGHSQGSGVLSRLIREEIEGKPAQERVVSAMLLGTNVAVPVGEDVGGAFERMPLCRSAGQTGCVISYVSFLADEPPPAGTFFGRVDAEGQVAACTNPASLDGSGGELRSYFVTESTFSSAEEPGPWVEGREITTPFVQLPDLVTAECVSDERGSYLAVTVHADPSDPRTDEIGGRVMAGGEPQLQWGLHLIDVPLAMGNLLRIAREQARSHLAGRGGR